MQPESIEQHLTKKYGPGIARSLRDPNSSLNRMGRENGIHWNHDRNVYPTQKAHALMEFVQQRKSKEEANQLMEIMYKAYFEDGADIADVNVLKGFAKPLLADSSSSSSSSQDTEIDAAIESALSVENQDKVTAKVNALRTKYRVSGVPHFIIESNTKGRPPATFSGAYPVDVLAEQLEEAAGI
mmetsp:Transcript_11820/g.34109  ORF Transcript_11820/g.34109 Transcript_11820/m.34109 type:complete len:184 (+) Transcript_11820:335-886(+)|eukprot:CAMPEP_0119553784 /NCGR_PEP_ID=MMETSP1352-20130426/6449_1 /TAXON_ID=265584 /ORGANISM="Stauroneis constricta, Strain CCMP1120" /LENGTH=183 /DNA_ID=CAMNT_0007600259 /DNA_START=281 /DNA_END=832 /DNA_ORIENTATION=+